MILKMKIKPNARGNKLVKVDHPDYDFKVFVNAAPDKGKANKALINFLAAKFGVKSAQVAIIKGHTESIKLVQIS